MRPEGFPSLPDRKTATARSRLWGAVALAAALVLSVLALEGLTLVGAVAAEPAPLLLLDPRAAAALAPDTLGRVIAADAVESPGVALANGSADGGCAGWTLLRAPGATTPVRLAAPVAGRFSPDAALRAVGRLPQIPAHVVLVAAGPPQCVSVACSVSRQLAARKPGLRIDVLALPPAGDRLRCVAGNSGGAFRSLEADGLAPALTGLFAAKGVAVAAAPPPPATAGPEPATVIPDAAPAKEAETRPGSVPVPRPAPRRSASVAKEPAAGTALASAPAVDTPAADTPVADETTAGATLRALPWVGPTAEDLPGAPEPEAWPQSSPPSVRLQAVPALGDVPLASELSYEVKAIGPDGVVRLVGRSWAAQPIFALPAGDYVARVTYRGVSREYRFHTKGQGLEHRSLPLDIGYAALRTVATAGAPPLLSNLEYTVRLPGGAPVIRRDPQPVLALPAGRYEIAVRSGAARAVATVTVKPGETLSQTFDLRLGYLRLRASTGGEGPVLFRVRREADEDTAASDPPVEAEITAPQGLALLRLPAGRYVATAEHDGRAVHQLVTVAPGELTQVTLQPQTARIGGGPI